jgi:hypothetical protein
LFKDFLLLNLNEYENFIFSFPIGAFIFFLNIALVASLFLYYYNKKATCAFLRGLLRHGAVGKSKAVTLKKLHLDGSFLLKSILSKKSGLIKRLTARVGEKSLTYEEHLAKAKEKGYREEKIDFSTAAFYIKEDCKEKAEDEISRNDVSILTPIVFSVVIAIITVLLMIYLGDILSFINDALA